MYKFNNVRTYIYIYGVMFYRKGLGWWMTQSTYIRTYVRTCSNQVQTYINLVWKYVRRMIIEQCECCVRMYIVTHCTTVTLRHQTDVRKLKAQGYIHVYVQAWKWCLCWIATYVHCTMAQWLTATLHMALTSVVSWSKRWVYFVLPERPKFFTWQQSITQMYIWTY